MGCISTHTCARVCVCVNATCNCAHFHHTYGECANVCSRFPWQAARRRGFAFFASTHTLTHKHSHWFGSRRWSTSTGRLTSGVFFGARNVHNITENGKYERTFPCSRSFALTHNMSPINYISIFSIIFKTLEHNTKKKTIRTIAPHPGEPEIRIYCIAV